MTTLSAHLAVPAIVGAPGEAGAQRFGRYSTSKAPLSVGEEGRIRLRTRAPQHFFACSGGAFPPLEPRNKEQSERPSGVRGLSEARLRRDGQLGR